MSSSKKDRTTAPRMGSRPSKAKHVDDRNVARRRATARGKPKRVSTPCAISSPGACPASTPTSAELDAVTPEAHDLDDSCSECECRVWTPVVPSDVTEGGSELPSSPAASPGAAASSSGRPGRTSSGDPWWTPERERAFSSPSRAPQHVVAASWSRPPHGRRWVRTTASCSAVRRERVAVQGVAPARAVQTCGSRQG